MTDAETLAARAVDRALRPWIASGIPAESEDGGADGGEMVRLPGGIDVRVSVQEYDPFPPDGVRHADPVALAVNAALAACYRALTRAGMKPPGAAGCVRVAMRNDGSYVLDPDPAVLEEDCAFDVLYAGTVEGPRAGRRDRVLMAEGGARERRRGGGEAAPVTEDAVAEALVLARKSIRPICEEMEWTAWGAEMEGTLVGVGDNGSAPESDEEVLADLLGVDVDPPERRGEDDCPPDCVPGFSEEDAAFLRERAVELVWDKLGRAALALFGDHAGAGGEEGRAPNADGGADGDAYAAAEVHSGGPLLTKAARGRREHVVRAEIQRILPGLLESDADGYHGTSAAATACEWIASDAECARSLATHVHERIMKRAMDECGSRDVRSDGRAGRNVVRPVGCRVPALGDAVHGSAGGFFSFRRAREKRFREASTDGLLSCLATMSSASLFLTFRHSPPNSLTPPKSSPAARPRCSARPR